MSKWLSQNPWKRVSDIFYDILILHKIIIDNNWQNSTHTDTERERER